MLVFKRALSLVLSLMLVAPTSALARANSKSANAHAAPVYMSSGQALATIMPAKVAGKTGSIEVLKESGKGKRLKSRISRQGDVSEVLVDNDEDGTADVWEVSRGSMKMKADRPYLGRFTRIEYTDRREKAEIKTTLQLNSDYKTYRVAKSEIVPYGKMYSGGVQAEMCAASTNEIKRFEDILKEIQEAVGGTKADGVLCKMRRYQNFLFDSSCKATPAMADSMDAMVRGLADVASSRGSDPAKLLQCLEGSGYGFHAAKIQDLLAKKLEYTRRKLQRAGVPTAQFNDNSCEPIDVNSLAGTADGSEIRGRSSRGLKPLFKCQQSLSSEQGAWDPETEQIVLTKSAATLQKGATSASDAYASLMFHELIHSSGISGEEEALIKNMQRCCSVTGSTEAVQQNSCAVIRQRHEDEQLVTRVTMALGFQDLQGNLKDAFGTSAAEEFTDRWVRGLRTDANASAAIEEFERCSSANPQNANCRTKVVANLTKYSDAFVKRECPAFKATARAGENISCESVKTEFSNLLNAPREVLTLPPPVEVTTENISLSLPVVTTPTELTEVMPRVNVLPTCSTNVVNRAARAITSIFTTPNCTPVASARMANIQDSANPLLSAPRAEVLDAPAAPTVLEPIVTTPIVATPVATPITTTPPRPRITTGTLIDSSAPTAAPVAPAAAPVAAAPAVAPAAPVTALPPVASAPTSRGSGRPANQAPAAVNPYTSPIAMPSAYVPSRSSGSGVPALGEGDRPLSAATPLLNLGEGITSQVLGALSSSTAHASQSARALVALPERNLASYQPSTATSDSGGSSRGSAVAARGVSPSSSPPRGRSGASAAPSSPSRSLAGASSSGGGLGNGSRVEDSSDPNPSGSAPQAAAQIESSPEEYSAPIRGAAAVSSRGTAQRTWTQNTFRSSTDARAFLATTPVVQVEALMRQPAFVDDLVRRRIGIRRNNGRFIGHSQPDIVYVECGPNLVLRGTCR